MTTTHGPHGAITRMLGQKPRSFAPKLPHDSALVAGKTLAPPLPSVDYAGKELTEVVAEPTAQMQALRGD